MMSALKYHSFVAVGTRLTIQTATNKIMKVQVPNKSNNNTFCLDSVGGYGSLILHDHVQHILT